MYIVTFKKEFSIWLTNNPFKKDEGQWIFLNNELEYEETLEELIKKYGKKSVLSLQKVTKMSKEHPTE